MTAPPTPAPSGVLERVAESHSVMMLVADIVDAASRHDREHSHESVAGMRTAHAALSKALRARDDEVERLTAALAEARAVALEDAEMVCHDLAWTHPSTRHLGPEQNCVKCAEAISKLRALTPAGRGDE